MIPSLDQIWTEMDADDEKYDPQTLCDETGIDPTNLAEFLLRMGTQVFLTGLARDSSLPESYAVAILSGIFIGRRIEQEVTTE